MFVSKCFWNFLVLIHSIIMKIQVNSLQYTYENYEQSVPTSEIQAFANRKIDPRNQPYLSYEKHSISECLLDRCTGYDRCYIQVVFKNPLYECSLFTTLLSDMGALVPSYDVSGVTSKWVFTNEQIGCSGYCTHLGSDYLCGKDTQCVESCGPSYYPFYCQGKTDALSSCTDLREAGHTISGLYNIQPDPQTDSMEVFCDMSSEKARILFFQRFDVEDSARVFNRTDYSESFGQPDSAYFIGLQNTYQLAKTGMRLETKILVGNAWHDASYTSIRVDGAMSNYRIHFNNHLGSLYDGFYCPTTNPCSFVYKTSSKGYTRGWWQVKSSTVLTLTSAVGIYEGKYPIQKVQMWLVEP